MRYIYKYLIYKIYMVSYIKEGDNRIIVMNIHGEERREILSDNQIANVVNEIKSVYNAISDVEDKVRDNEALIDEKKEEIKTLLKTCEDLEEEISEMEESVNKYNGAFDDFFVSEELEETQE